MRRRQGPPLQTFFFEPSFIAFVRHSSDSFVPQLQHPSWLIFTVVALDGVGVSAHGDGFVCARFDSGSAEGGTALRSLRSMGLLASFWASSGDILPSERKRAWRVAREGVEGGGERR